MCLKNLFGFFIQSDSFSVENILSVTTILPSQGVVKTIEYRGVETEVHMKVSVVVVMEAYWGLPRPDRIHVNS